jgi:hypothetical protein
MDRSHIYARLALNIAYNKEITTKTKDALQAIAKLFERYHGEGIEEGRNLGIRRIQHSEPTLEEL